MKKNNVILESNDNYEVKIPNNYVLIGSKSNKSILLQDIGIHSEGFANVIILSIILSLSAIFSLYLLFRI